MPKLTLYVSDADQGQLRRHPGLNRSLLFAKGLEAYFRDECECPVHANHRQVRGGEPALAPSQGE